MEASDDSVRCGRVSAVAMETGTKAGKTGWLIIQLN
jgi:hypothetical protein